MIFDFTSSSLNTDLLSPRTYYYYYYYYYYVWNLLFYKEFWANKSEYLTCESSDSKTKRIWCYFNEALVV